MGIKLIPLPFFVGLAGGLALLSFAGSIVRNGDLVDHFVRFHQLINVEAGYFPTARQVKAIVDKTIDDDSLIYVIIGGDSVFHGVGQHESLLWTRHLQEHLGPRFRVINFAQRAGSPTDFGNVAAEYLLSRSKRVIFVADAGLNPYTKPIAESFYRHVIFDAWQRKLLLSWAPRDKLLSEAAWKGPKAVQEPALGAMLDAYLNFNDFWGFIAFHYANMNWNWLLGERSFQPRSSFNDPELLPEQYALLRYRDEVDQAMRILRAEIVPPASSIWRNAIDTTEQMVPPRLRDISLVVAICLDSPYYLRRLTAAEREAYLNTARYNAGLLSRIGFNYILFPTLEFADDDYVDRIHLSVSGGKKLADAIAPLVKQMAADLGYLR